MLAAEELKRRIEAARILRGIHQTELDRLFDEDGLGKKAGRLERGDLALSRALLDGLIRHLKVPERWFTDPDVDTIVGWGIAGATGKGDFTTEQLQTIQQAAALLAAAGQSSEQGEPRRREASGGQGHPAGPPANGIEGDG